MVKVDYDKLLSVLPTAMPAAAQKLIKKGSENILAKLVPMYPERGENDMMNAINDSKYQCRCTACGNEFYAYRQQDTNDCYNGYRLHGYIDPKTSEPIYIGNMAKCPLCGIESRTVETYRYGCILHHEIIATVENKNGIVVVTKWKVHIWADENLNEEIKIAADEAILIDGKRLYRAVGANFGRWKKSKAINDKWAILTRCDDVMGYIPKTYIVNSLEGTALENAKISEYAGNRSCYLISYIKMYLKHENVENLIMSGMAKYLDEIIQMESHTTLYSNSVVRAWDLKCVNWSRVKPHEMLNLKSKSDLKIIKKNGIRPRVVNFCNRYEEKVKIENVLDIEDVMNNSIIRNEDIIQRIFSSEKNPIRVMKYIKLQHGLKSIVDIHYLYDYWEMAKNLNYNMNDTAIKYPKNLVTAHDNATKVIKAKEDEALNERIMRRYKELKKFEYATENIEIHPAMSSNEFVKEGKELSHCVATYQKRYADAKTAIFFIRHTSEPDKPYFTLELDEKTLTVRQNRGSHNCDRTPEVKKFEKEWLSVIRKIGRRHKNGQTVKACTA